MAVDRNHRRNQAKDDGDRGNAPAEQMVEALGDEHRIHHVESGEGEQGADQRQDHAAIAELRARLDHLRQAQVRPLAGVEGHEQRAEQDAERAGDGGVGKTQPHPRPDEPDGDGEELEITEEPERPLIDGFAVPFAVGNIVDRAGFNPELRAVAHAADFGVSESRHGESPKSRSGSCMVWRGLARKSLFLFQISANFAHVLCFFPGWNAN